jgi:hypothetical protein
MNAKQLKKEAATHGQALVMPLWPDAGQALGLSRNATYDAARRGPGSELMQQAPSGRLWAIASRSVLRGLGSLESLSFRPASS